MFHIKPDKRSRTSAALVVEGLHKCLETKPFSKITITDIQKASYVGRATFYRLFDTMADVLAYECELLFQSYLSREGDRNFSAFISYWMEQEPLLTAITQSGHMDMLYQVYRSHASELGQLLVPDIALTDEEVDFLVATATAAIVGFFSAWVSHGKRESAEELTEILKKDLKTIYRSID